MLSNPQVKFVSNRDGGDRLTNNPSEQVPSSHRVISDGKHVGLVVKRNGKWGFYLKHREPRDEFDDDIYDFSRGPFAVGRTLAALKTEVRKLTPLSREELADMGFIV